MGHREQIIGDGRGDDHYQKRMLEWRPWREGVSFGGHSRDVENVPEPPRPNRGVSDPAGEKRLPSRSTAPTDGQPWTRAEYIEEIRRGTDGGVTPWRVHEAYGAGQPERLSRKKIRLRGC